MSWLKSAVLSLCFHIICNDIQERIEGAKKQNKQIKKKPQT